MSKLLTVLLLVMAPLMVQAEVIHIKNVDQHIELANNKTPMVIMLGADWCSYCKLAYPEFVKAEKAYKGKVRFAYIDIDEVGIKGLPFVPSFVMSHETLLFDTKTLNKHESYDFNGIMNYVEKYTGVKP